MSQNTKIFGRILLMHAVKWGIIIGITKTLKRAVEKS